MDSLGEGEKVSQGWYNDGHNVMFASTSTSLGQP